MKQNVAQRCRLRTTRVFIVWIRVRTSWKCIIIIVVIIITIICVVSWSWLGTRALIWTRIWVRFRIGMYRSTWKRWLLRIWIRSLIRPMNDGCMEISICYTSHSPDLLVGEHFPTRLFCRVAHYVVEIDRAPSSPGGVTSIRI